MRFVIPQNSIEKDQLNYVRSCSTVSIVKGYTWHTVRVSYKCIPVTHDLLLSHFTVSHIIIYYQSIVNQSLEKMLEIMTKNKLSFNFKVLSFCILAESSITVLRFLYIFLTFQTDKFANANDRFVSLSVRNILLYLFRFCKEILHFYLMHHV